MFTGLVETVGTILAADADGHGGRTLVVNAPAIAAELVLGESVSVCGACLTVVKTGETFAFQAGPETLAKTTLGDRKPGDRVNLERALKVGDRLGGHFVTGHVDGVGRVLSREVSGEWEIVRFATPPEFDELLVPKGSVAVDGVSLTVVDPRPGSFAVMLIPHTLAHTTLGTTAVGGAVNLEADLLAKHVRKLLHPAGK